MNILIHLTLMFGLILAVMSLPLLYWRGFRARPRVALLVTLLSLFVLAGAGMSFDRLFPGCRALYSNRISASQIYDCRQRR